MARPYRPSNGAEGMDFIDRWCGRCLHDEAYRNGTGNSCPIVANSLVFGVDDPKYPKEWVQDEPWGNARCTAFVDIGADIELVAARSDERQRSLL
jgi:hypothetical protein